MHKKDYFILIIALLILIGLMRELDYRSAQAATNNAILSDPESGAVTILVDGRKVVRIDGNGLQIEGDLSYSGTLTDSGSDFRRPPADGDEDGERPR